jgi:hypothetical protein
MQEEHPPFVPFIPLVVTPLIVMKKLRPLLLFNFGKCGKEEITRAFRKPQNFTLVLIFHCGVSRGFLGT